MNIAQPFGSRLVALALAFMGIVSTSARADKWQDQSLRVTLKNETLEATFQAGLLVQLKDQDHTLINLEPASLPKELAVFGPALVDLNSCTVEQKTSDRRVETTYKTAAGDQFAFVWSIEPGKGDLVARFS